MYICILGCSTCTFLGLMYSDLELPFDIFDSASVSAIIIDVHVYLCAGLWVT